MAQGQRCPTGYATEMGKKCGKHLWQVRRLYTLESGKTIIGSCQGSGTPRRILRS